MEELVKITIYYYFFFNSIKEIQLNESKLINLFKIKNHITLLIFLLLFLKIFFLKIHSLYKTF
jgi:hypothetical protein